MSSDVLGLVTGFQSQSVAKECPFELPVITAEDAAKYLQVDVKDVIQEAETGNLPGQKIGNQRRFLVLGLLEWLRAGNQPAAQLNPQSSKQRMLALAGMWKDDLSVDAMMEEIEQRRKADSVGGR